MNTYSLIDVELSTNTISLNQIEKRTMMAATRERAHDEKKALEHRKLKVLSLQWL